MTVDPMRLTDHRKTTRSTRAAGKSKLALVSPDELADQLATTLKISKGKGKAAVSDEDRRLAAMRSVNLASQSISAVVQSGWKLKTGGGPISRIASTQRSVNASATSISKCLQDLREICPGDADVERAAISVVGKLIVVEMFDVALSELSNMRRHLCSLYHPSPSLKPNSSRRKPTAIDSLYLLSLPIPPPGLSIDSTILTLLSLYLLHAITSLSHCIFSAIKSKPGVPASELFSKALIETSSLLKWIPFLSPLKTTHKDSMLTSVYTTLSKLSIPATYPQSATHLFRIRIYALSCLLHASAGTVERDKFWYQATKFATTLVNSVPSDKTARDNVTQTILFSFSDLVITAERREDESTFMGGGGFAGFCEYWTKLAKRVEDIGALNQISKLMRSASIPPSVIVEVAGETAVSQKKEFVVQEGAKLCIIFAQTTTLLDQFSSQPDSRIGDLEILVGEAISLTRDSLPLVFRHQGASAEDVEAAQRTADKVERALERMRRATVKVVEAKLSTSATRSDGDCLKLLLIAIVDALKDELTVKPNTNILTQALDTLFVLSRTLLDVKSFQTYGPAYDFLAQAVTLLDLDNTAAVASDQPSNRATFVRCVSGAFYNLGTSLYQEERFGPAVRFLKEGCNLGEKALHMYRKGPNVAAERKQAWVGFEQQLYRWWELLGVCYIKMGDRKLAFSSFTQSVKTFPSSEFTEQTLMGGPGAVFNASTGLKQLGAIIDKLTYLGSCELLLDPICISLKTTGEACSDAITGILLERQLDSLKGFIRKEGVRLVGTQLLADAKDVYREHDMPVRRARILIRSLDLEYHTGSQGEVGLECQEDIAREAEELLTRANLGQDSSLAPFCSQHRALVHLWLALHAHRQKDSKSSTTVAYHAEEACKFLQHVISIASDQETTLNPRKSTSKHRVVGKKGTAKSSTVRRAASVKKPPIAAKRPPETPKQRKALESLDVTPPRKSSEVKKSLVVLEDFERLLGLLQTVATLLGLVGCVLSRIRILETIRQLCEWHTGGFYDGYLDASIELAYEYTRLGKIKKAGSIFTQAVNTRSGQASNEVRVRFFLRKAEYLALHESISRSSSVYCEALGLSNTMVDEEKRTVTSQRVRTHVTHLARAAMASRVFAIIQISKDDVASALEGMLQSFRLWNRAADALARLNSHTQPAKPASESNPFEVGSTKDSEHSESSRSEQPLPYKTSMVHLPLDSLELRVAQGLLDTLFTLCDAYFARGSAREAEFFAQQAHDFAESLNALALVGRALARKGEVHLHQGQLQEGSGSIKEASRMLQGTPSTDGADVRRLQGDYSQLCAEHTYALERYTEATGMLEELDRHMGALEDPPFRKSLSTVNSTTEVLVPALFATVLREHIWLLRDDSGHHRQTLLNRLLSLPPSSQTKAEETALMAKLTLHDVYRRFNADMFLSSLTESPIALPMGMSGERLRSLVPVTQDILNALGNAEKLFWADLGLIAKRGKVSHVRDAVVSLALIRALQTSLGKAGKEGPVLAVNLLDVSTSITLRRDMLEAIQNKFPDFQTFDDLQWPLMTPNGSPLPRQKSRRNARLEALTLFDDESSQDDVFLREYWQSIKFKYKSQVLDAPSLSTSHVDNLPENWTVVTISVKEDKSTMFITRQRATTEPLMFCLPLKGRRENDEDEHLTFDDAMNEFGEIIRQSDEGTRQAVNVRSDDPQARSAWWAERRGLDKRLKELLENIEFCWLGAFKTILSPPMNTPPEALGNLRAHLDKIFQRGLRSQEKKQKTRVRLNDTLLECFSSLSPKCRDEELEDLVYFILDLYQFHGIAVAIAEVDVDQVAVDVRTALEEHAAKTKGKVVPEKDSHMFLVLDKNVQGIPWESIPILRGRSVSRIPSLEFLLDRIDFARRLKGLEVHGVAEGGDTVTVDRAVVDPRKTYYVLNPSGDLGRTEGRFASWLKDMHKVGWKGVVGRPPSEQEFLNALCQEDLLIYFGHGGGEQYVRSHKVRSLPRCAATMLWGCSSGALREMGDFDRVGTPHHYMLAGCPTLVANIWDVTDRDIDKFAQSVFDKLHLTASDIAERDEPRGRCSVVEAVAGSRECCKLKYLTGAAAVVYGIPFYL